MWRTRGTTDRLVDHTCSRRVLSARGGPLSVSQTRPFTVWQSGETKKIMTSKCSWSRSIFWWFDLFCYVSPMDNARIHFQPLSVNSTIFLNWSSLSSKQWASFCCSSDSITMALSNQRLVLSRVTWNLLLHARSSDFVQSPFSRHCTSQQCDPASEHQDVFLLFA